MADEAFDDGLFAEFDREEVPTDRVLMSKIRKDLLPCARNLNQVSEQDRICQDDSKNGTEIAAGDNASDSQEYGDSETESDRVPEKNTSPSSTTTDELSQLRKENDKYRNLVGTDSHFQIEEGPVLEIIYMNQAFARRNHHEIEMFLSHLLEQDQLQFGDNRKLATCAGRSNILCLAGKCTQSPTPMEKLRQMETGMVMGCSHYYQNFLVDIMGWPLVDYDPAKTDGWYVPHYMQIYLEPLPVDEEEDEDGKPQKNARPKRSCFNCGGDHNLSECTEQKNQQRIRDNMKAFKSSQGNNSSASLKNSRYHEEECDPCFASFRPGVISAELRDAMGLRSNQLPPHIYMMRNLGYPPGWLEAAKEETSGLAVFDGAGKELNKEGEAVEDGEVNESNAVQPKYNLGKLVDYPGFNVQPSEGVKDDHENLRSIPMQPEQSKEALKLYLTPADGPPTGRKRRSTAHRDEDGAGKKMCVDMDLDSSQNEDEGTSTPTLEDLEERQRVLQMQLALAEGGSSGSADIAVLDSADTDSQDEEGFIPPIPPTPEQPPLPPGTPPSTPGRKPGQQSNNSSPLNASFKTPLPVTPLVTPNRTPQTVGELVRTTPGSGGSIERKYSTPVHADRTTTPNSKGLPELGKFSLGVSQHIPFENLPDSTGNFKRLRSVLADIRSSGKKHVEGMEVEEGNEQVEEHVEEEEEGEVL